MAESETVGSNGEWMVNLSNSRPRWFVRGVLVGIALMLALHFVLTQ